MVVGLRRSILAVVRGCEGRESGRDCLRDWWEVEMIV